MTTSTASIDRALTPQMRPPRTQTQIIWHKFRRHKAAVLSGIVLIVMIIVCFGAPWIAPYEFDAIDLRNTRQPPSLDHLMGTDDLGRDAFTRLLYGGRISLTVGIFAALVATTIGAVLGAVAGFYGGGTDNVLMRFTEVIIAIPSLPLLIILSSYTQASVVVIILIIGLLSWMATARIVRGSVHSVKRQDFVMAARMMGCRNATIIGRHIIPNVMGPIIVGATLGVGAAIIIESSLSFLGLGISPPTPTWGNMLQDSQSTMATKPWLTIFPGLAILITVLCINFLGEGLHDALDPTMRSDS
ncbi:MAG: ABC transporter permease [Caldilinea sp.]|nr:ABC transporter permease [Caldilineaceae bacterium]MCB9124932.1 ABC transporter permease [Caldilineaceae bacterium]MCO5213065.1 ABC transporter permease [Caldilinea sp.]MCW5843104.1 ABC transporter permease [Caldilinea sp.]HRW49630.1 ABC transporter permease [Caldilinea sp.]